MGTVAARSGGQSMFRLLDRLAHGDAFAWTFVILVVTTLAGVALIKLWWAGRNSV